MTQVIEAVAWDNEVVKDQMRYGKVKGLLKKLVPIGIRTATVRNTQPTGGRKTIKINFLPSNTKFINPYTFLGVMVRVRQMKAIASLDVTNDQLGNIADTTVDLDPIFFAWHCSYNERNPDFHMAKV